VPPGRTAWLLDTRPRGRLAGIFGGRQTILSRAVNVRPVFPCKRIWALGPEERTGGVVDLRRGDTVAWLKFASGVQEVFAVALLPRRFPDLINDDEKLLESSFVVPTARLGDVAARVRAPGRV
jgi:hypothetical protein